MTPLSPTAKPSKFPDESMNMYTELNIVAGVAAAVMGIEIQLPVEGAPPE
jgi:hypothetical protein